MRAYTIILALLLTGCATIEEKDKTPITPQQKCEQKLLAETFTRADGRVMAKQIELIKFHCNIKHNSDK